MALPSLSRLPITSVSKRATALRVAPPYRPYNVAQALLPASPGTASRCAAGGASQSRGPWWVPAARAGPESGR